MTSRCGSPVQGAQLLSISSFASPMVINGHEYVACQARKAGIRFTKEGNCFTHISDAAGLARIADTLSGCCLAFHPIRSGPATINGNPRDHAPCGSRHLTQSGRRSHSCRLADPGNGYSNSRACLAGLNPKNETLGKGALRRERNCKWQRNEWGGTQRNSAGWQWSG